jgi:hypothetical protein
MKSELDQLRRRVDEMEVRLDTRIAAEEMKRADEVGSLRIQLGELTGAMRANTNLVANLASQVRASHYALVHLLAVTARQVRVPDKDLQEAMRVAEEAIKQ